MTKGFRYDKGKKLSPTSKDMRLFIHESIKGGMTGYLREVYATIQQVERPHAKAKLMLDFLKFFMPELKAVEIDNKQDVQPIQLTFVKADGTKQIVNNAQGAIDAAVDVAVEGTDDEDGLASLGSNESDLVEVYDLDDSEETE